MLIEKNVPVPSSTAQRGRPAVYPFKQMHVGDSFVVPKDRATALRCRVGKAAQQYGIKLVTRKQPDGSLRCWRIPAVDPFS
jgi:hypothetical protein